MLTSVARDDPSTPAPQRWWEEVFPDEERAIYSQYRRPRENDFPWAHSALVVIDVTAAFLGPDVPTIEACQTVRTACGSPGWRAVERIAIVLDAYRAADRRVVYTNPNWSVERFLGGATGGRVRDVDSESDRVPDSIAGRPDDYVLYKPKASALFETGLVAYCIRNRIEGLVLTGGTTSGCVRSTAIDACSYGLDVVIVEDGCFDRSRLSEAVALYELDVKYARIHAAADVVRAVSGSH